MKQNNNSDNIFNNYDHFKFLSISEQPRVIKSYKWDRSQFMNFLENSLKDVSSNKMVFKTLSH